MSDDNHYRETITVVMLILLSLSIPIYLVDKYGYSAFPLAVMMFVIIWIPILILLSRTIR